MVGALFWAGPAGFAFTLAGSLLVFYHYELAIAERARASLGFTSPVAPGTVDRYMVSAMLLPIVAAAVTIAAGWIWYRRAWSRRLRDVWSQTVDDAFRDVRMAAVKQLPKMATGGLRDRLAGWLSRES